MAEPKIRFKRDDGSSYPAWKEYFLADILTERNEPHLITDDAPQLSFTIEQGVIYPEDKKTNKRDFLMKDKDNKKFLLTEFNDIIYNPANLKFGAIHRNALGRGVVSPIYAIFYTDQNSVFIEGIVTNPKFIKRSLKFLEGTVEKLKTLKPRDFLKMRVWIPCLEEQQKIAAFLISVDEIIMSSEAEIENLEAQKKAVMRKVFSQKVRFKKDDGTDYPNWQVSTLEDVCRIVKGRQIEKGDISENGKYYHLNGGIAPSNRTNQWNTERNTISISEGGNSCGFVAWNTESFFSGGHNYTLQDVTDALVPLFLYHYLKYKENDLMALRVGSGLPNIQSRALAPFEIEIPCLEEQRQVAAFLSEFDEVITATKKELELWKELKKGLLQQMFV